MKTTLRQIDKALSLIAEGHDLKPDYFWGDYADAFEGRKASFPLIVCNVQPVVQFGRATVIKINVIAVDQVLPDQSNLADVESDTLQLLHDYFKVMKNSPNWRDFCAVQTAGTNLKFKDSGPDEVAGWQEEVTIKLIEVGGLCDVPISQYDINKKINC